ncbi:hypothetical protein [Nocardioides psychrotolerans]|uniref:Esterase-like activity of phytase n=1 Tax=Nocardioides psychrotolerans TaxID=1005945 RepID=A0A1I3R574_9ACTN|nr:hypothetical protein [Nocardioides psychrotolerans]SFJ40591.1 hypothetical protein SAMN05216561_12924 [Nocardioides psychrotolerans]
MELPDGFQPEGIAIGKKATDYFGSRLDGDIYAADLRTGAGKVVSQGPGTPSVGLKVDKRERLFVSGGTAGDARVADARTSEVLASYQLAEGTAFINEVVLTRDTVGFTDSENAQLFALSLGPKGELPAPEDAVTIPLVGDWVQNEGLNANGTPRLLTAAACSWSTPRPASSSASTGSRARRRRSTSAAPCSPTVMACCYRAARSTPCRTG